MYELLIFLKINPGAHHGERIDVLRKNNRGTRRIIFSIMLSPFKQRTMHFITVINAVRAVGNKAFRSEW